MFKFSHDKHKFKFIKKKLQFLMQDYWRTSHKATKFLNKHIKTNKIKCLQQNVITGLSKFQSRSRKNFPWDFFFLILKHP